MPIPGVEKGSVLVFDGTGGHAAPSLAEHIARARGGGQEVGEENRDGGQMVVDPKVELISADRNVAQEMGALNYPIHMQGLYERGVKITVDHVLETVELEKGNHEGLKRAVLRNVFTDRTIERRGLAQVVVEHGTLPNDELYLELRDMSRNCGEHHMMPLGKTPDTLAPTRNPEGDFFLFRVGDSVSSRNIHAAILDSLRLCKDF